MDFFFTPRGIAVVGASPSQGKGGNIIVENLKQGYTGKIYPVNPRYETIAGLPCYASVEEVPDPIDLCIVFVGASLVPGVVESCARRAIPGVMIQSAGFAEAGDQGLALQKQTLEIAEQAGIRIWGPNCMGLVDTRNRYVFSTVVPLIWQTGLVSGDVSLIVQSGMLSGAFLIDLMSHGITGVNKVCSIGNKMDVDENDLLEFLLRDPTTKAVGLYLESFAQGRRFADLVQQGSKPVAVLNGGTSAKGAAASLSHTASLSGNGAVAAGVLAQIGVAQARGFYQLVDFSRTLAAFADYEPARGLRVAVLTYSGGAGIVSADYMDGFGLTPANLSRESLEQLKTVFPAWMPPDNPVDLWPGVILNGGRKTYETAMQAVCNDPEVDGVFVHAFSGGFDLDLDLETLSQMARQAGKPFVCWISGNQEQVKDFQLQAHQLDVPVFREVLRGIECLAVALKTGGQQSSLAPDPTADPRMSQELEAARELMTGAKGQLDEHLSKQILNQAGIPVVPEQAADSLEEACAAAEQLGYPLVLKGLLPETAHKTEAGLVHLGIGSIQDLKKAYEGLQTTLQGRGRILVQKQIQGDLELIIGLVRDPHFGQTVMCGFGGVLAEAVGDAVFAMAPLSHDQALALIDRLKAQRLLNGFRGASPLDREALARIVVALGELARENPGIQEIDINPLIVDQGLPVAVDALMVCSEVN